MGSIVVGRRRTGALDGALRFAGTEARLRGRSLALTHVWNIPVEVAVNVDAVHEFNAADTARAVCGPVASTLMQQDAELLVLGRHTSPTPHLSRVLRACLHHASCPLVIVPPNDPGQVRRIVVGVGDSQASAVAARWAAAEAELHHARLVLVRGWQLRPRGWSDLFRPVHAADEHQPQAERDLRGWAREVLPDVDTDTIAFHGGPLDALLDAGSRADLLVVGRSTRSSASRAVRGRIVDDLAALSSAPVAIIPLTPLASSSP